jgi:hypothetical protein
VDTSRGALDTLLGNAEALPNIDNRDSVLSDAPVNLEHEGRETYEEEEEPAGSGARWGRPNNQEPRSDIQPHRHLRQGQEGRRSLSGFTGNVERARRAATPGAALPGANGGHFGEGRLRSDHVARAPTRHQRVAERSQPPAGSEKIDGGVAAYRVGRQPFPDLQAAEPGELWRAEVA